jgi:hypothetical protein
MVNAMPYWWTTAYWKTQFPKDASSSASLDMDYLKSKHGMGDSSIHYCPNFAGPRKKGRRKNTSKRAKGVLEVALDEYKGVKKRRKVATEAELLEGQDGDEGSV